MGVGWERRQSRKYRSFLVIRDRDSVRLRFILGLAMKRKTIGYLVILSIVGWCVSPARVAAQPSFPSLNEWIPIQCEDPANPGTYIDAFDSPADETANQSRNIVGNWAVGAMGPSDMMLPASMWYEDDLFLYMAMLLDDDPSGTGGQGAYAQFGWSFLFSTDGNQGNGHEYILILDGISIDAPAIYDATGACALPNGMGGCNSQYPNATHTQLTDLGLNYHASNDFLLAFAIPKADIEQLNISAGLLLASGSSTNSTGINKDMMCGTGTDFPTVPTIEVDLAVCGDGDLDDDEGCDLGGMLNGQMGSACTSDCLIVTGQGTCTGAAGCADAAAVCVGGTCLLPGGEVCTDGTECVSGMCVGGFCTAPPPMCGNGLIEGSEVCDSGSGNGAYPADCSTNCRLNAGHTTGSCGDAADCEDTEATCNGSSCAFPLQAGACSAAAQCADANTVCDADRSECAIAVGSMGCVVTLDCEGAMAVCDAGRCAIPTGNMGCTISSDCQDGDAVCSSNTCLLPNGTGTCGDASDCVDTNAVCQSSTCLLPTGAMTCAVGNECVSGVCAAPLCVVCIAGGMAVDEGCTGPEPHCVMISPTEVACRECESDAHCTTMAAPNCSPSGMCTGAACGNNTLEPGEGCDDGDQTSGDGCDENCLVENGSACNMSVPGLTGDDSCASGICNSSSQTCDGDADGDGIGDTDDVDDDNDGINDVLEGDGAVDSDGDGIPDSRDRDSDGDGLTDAAESGNVDPDLNGDGQPDGCLPVTAQGACATTVTTPSDADGDSIPDFRDVDSDGDQIPDAGETVGGSALGQDSDGDGIDDGFDPDSGGQPAMTADTDGDGRPDHEDIDSDGDGLPDNIECPDPTRCPDTDADGLPNHLDEDADGDGIPDIVEANDADADGLIDVAPSGADMDADGLDDVFDADNGGSPPSQTDTDGDGSPDYLDTDADGDGFPDVVEDLTTDLSGQDHDSDGLDDSLDPDCAGMPLGCAVDSGLREMPTNTDGSGPPDYLDPIAGAADSDGDGIPDLVECGVSPLPADLMMCPLDSDGDLTSNVLDTDDDGDGILTNDEGGAAIDSDGDGRPDYLDLDADGDGIIDGVECGLLVVSPAACVMDSDGDGIRDYLDLDSDNDGYPDLLEGHDSNSDGVADRVPVGMDADGDGLDNAFDSDAGGVTAPIQDSDTDMTPDFQDADDDGDGVPSSLDCVGASPCPDGDGSGTPDYLEPGVTPGDADMDGVPDAIECGAVVVPADLNTCPQDTDGDMIPDALDADDDNDTIPTKDEVYDGDRDATDDDTDGDGIADYLDEDDDDDGYPTEDEVMGCGAMLSSCADADMDGIPNYRDVCGDGNLSNNGLWKGVLGWEECDDGNTIAGDGCETSCRLTCTVDAQCGGTTPVCRTDMNRCVQCTDAATHCATNEICSAAGTCQAQCTSDNDCTDPATMRCDTTINVCVACTDDAHCPSNQTCNSLNMCQDPCTSDADCTDMGAPRCSVANTCVACLNDTHCAEGERCNEAGQCINAEPEPTGVLSLTGGRTCAAYPSGSRPATIWWAMLLLVAFVGRRLRTGI